MRHFSKISEFVKYVGFPEAESEKFYIIDIKDLDLSMVKCESDFISSDFYSISIVNVEGGYVQKGNSEFNYSKGSLVTMTPNQKINWKYLSLKSEGFVTLFHKDFIESGVFNEKLFKYNSFKLPFNQSFYINNLNKRNIESILKNIEREKSIKHDEVSLDILYSYIDLLLMYTFRIYKNQAMIEPNITENIALKLKTILQTYKNEGGLELNGIPDLEFFASKMKMSKRSLQNKIKSESNTSFVKIINNLLIEEAKLMLIETDFNVTEIAYKLGFSYLQYFTRLFKELVGQSPSSYKSNSFKD
jgi:AraC-like DNA-binding protein